jgi:hypothetical protein
MTEQTLQKYLIKQYPKGGRGLRVEGILCITKRQSRAQEPEMTKRVLCNIINIAMA